MTGTADKGEPPSLGALRARAARNDEGRLALRRALENLVITARDGYEIAEVVVDARGQVVDVALNSTIVSRVEVGTLANAVLEATRTAQRNASEETGRLRSYYLGT